VPELPWGARAAARPRIVLLDGAVVGDLGIADDLLAPFRALGPELDSFGSSRQQL
jgi:hypothetical protein